MSFDTPSFCSSLPGSSPAPLRILYQDDDLVAIHKPAGHVVHRTKLCPDAPVILGQLRDQLGRFLYPIHRLDRATCGILLFGFSAAAAGAVCQSFMEKNVTKRYWAVVRGWTDEEGVIDHAYVETKGKPPRPAVTRFRRLATCELPIALPPYATCRYSLVQVEPETGRTHQIRRHFKHINHPVIGDTEHGRGEHNRLFREHFGIRRLLLQAIHVTLPHPATGEPLTIQDTLDAEFADLFDTLGWPVDR
ncbi:MAG: pseudouridine synthase [Lentisphaeria bacterium]|nr:pseudouridine synthase [Lentisphaeria bacterium]